MAVGQPGRAADRDTFLSLARSGWTYELRRTMVGRDLSIPVHINGRALSGASLCIVGEPPSDQSLEVLETFSELARHVFGKPLPMRYAGPDARLCGVGRTVILRLYSGFPPNDALSRDLGWLSEAYDLGLPRGRFYAATSPGMGQTFFGKRGQATHLMVQQAPAVEPGSLDEIYHRSILIEELFQGFTFGMDILKFRPTEAFASKLQEVPLNIQRLPWGSPAFKRALMRSNPPRLCEFDVFMLHAVAQAPVEQTTDPAFLKYIETHYDALLAQTAETHADTRFAAIVGQDCTTAVR